MTVFTTTAVAQDRYATCQQCEHWINATRMCGQCGCFMPFKVRFYNANCPVGRWSQERGSRSAVEPDLSTLAVSGEHNENNK